MSRGRPTAGGGVQGAACGAAGWVGACELTQCFRAAACGERERVSNELRASAGQRLRPAQSYGLHFRFLVFCSLTTARVRQQSAPSFHFLLRYLLFGQKVTPKTAAVKRFRGRPCDCAESDAFGTFEAIKRSPIPNAPSPRPPFVRNRFCRG